MLLEERFEAGRALRATVPRSALAEDVTGSRPRDPVALLIDQGADRLQDLLPIRYGRMSTSPFAFLRGAAAVMAHDLGASPRTGIDVQACGDAHVANLGIFATPERTVVFDLNDFDETQPGPWEWDAKRLATSIEVVGRDRGMKAEQRRAAVVAMVTSYARWMQRLARMSHLDVWYSQIAIERLLERLDRPLRARAQRQVTRARRKDRFRAVQRLTEVVDGHRRFVERPPLQQRVDLGGDEFVRQTFEDYLASLRDDTQILLRRYRIVDIALRVVGVGSVGTRCFVVLLEGRDDDDPLVLQVKEAGASVLAPYVGPSRYENQGRRVVEGQRLVQAASDIFLGWMEARTATGKAYYWRQLYDVKGSVDLETIEPNGLVAYGRVCGAAMARAHARSSDAARLSGYLGRGRRLADAIAAFAVSYADQTERDHTRLVAAIAEGRVGATPGI